MHYPAISKIVEDEANKRGLLYAKYDTLPQIIGRFTRQVFASGACGASTSASVHNFCCGGCSLTGWRMMRVHHARAGT